MINFSLRNVYVINTLYFAKDDFDFKRLIFRHLKIQCKLTNRPRIFVKDSLSQSAGFKKYVRFISLDDLFQILNHLSEINHSNFDPVSEFKIFKQGFMNHVELFRVGAIGIDDQIV